MGNKQRPSLRLGPGLGGGAGGGGWIAPVELKASQKCGCPWASSLDFHIHLGRNPGITSVKNLAAPSLPTATPATTCQALSQAQGHQRWACCTG